MPAPANNAPATSRTTRRRRATAVLAAVLAPAAIWLVAVPLLGVDLQVAQPSGRAPAQITLPLVLVTALAGWGLLALLERLTRRARTIWTATAVVALVVSFASLLAPGTSTTARIVLALLHLTVAAILIPALARSAAAAGA